MEPELREDRCENCNLVSDELIETDAENFRKNYLGRKSGHILVCNLCDAHFTRRNEYSQTILNSISEKRLIVAGPGTGKTFTFGEVIRGLPSGGCALVFTLINNLASELEQDLSKIESREVRVNTFHGYCKELLHSKVSSSDISQYFAYAPLLPKLIQEDANLLGFSFSEKDFSRCFANLEEGPEISFYLGRGSYYNAISHIDSVYRVYSFFKDHPDQIPEYDVVIADEYQDFNKLEAEFISLLSTKNGTLLAGDDDQALYGFREAKKEFIQDLHNFDTSFENLYLPFCSRCTPVIVEAVKSVVEKAQTANLLQNRIPREFISYWPEKYKEHGEHPQLHIAKCSQLGTVPKYVETRILDLVQAEGLQGDGNDIPFMIIGPESGYHLDKIKGHLLSSLDTNLFEVIDSRKDAVEVELAEGYLLLQEGVNKNLGWRIILHLDPPENLQKIISISYQTGQDLDGLLPEVYKARHLKIIEESEKTPPISEEKEVTPETPNRVKILLTNFLGSKGLAARHVIIVGLNNGTVPSNVASIEDEEVCKFLVALTRAKNSCCLVVNKEWDKSSKKTLYRPSIFLTWLPQDKISTQSYRVTKGKLVAG